MSQKKHFLLMALVMLGLAAATVHAETASVLLEKAIHKEQAAGELDAAIQIYRQIIDDAKANRKYVAEAQYRLGTCLLKKGSKKEAREAFERVVSEFSDRKEVAARARGQLAGMLQLTPAPWADGELMRLNLRMQAGAELGTVIYTAESVKVAGKDAWRLESYVAVPISNLRQFTRVDARRDTLAPISSVTKNLLGDFRAEFGDKVVQWKTDAPRRKIARKVEVEGVAYDNEQAIHLLRCMPLAEGFRTSFTIFPVQSGIVSECTIVVAGKEEVTTPAGKFTCHKVDLNARFAGGNIHQQLWFSADAKRYLVKILTNNVIIELVEVGKKAKDAPTVFEDKKLGIALTVPPGWYFYKESTPQQDRLMVHLLVPEMKAWSGLAAAARAPTFTTPRNTAEQDVAVVERFFEGYTVRPKSWTERKLSGLPAAQYVADYKQDGRDMVEYRTYALGDKTVYWLIFRTQKDRFDAARKEFDSVISGLKLSEPALAVTPDTGKKEAESLTAEGWLLSKQRKFAEAEAKFKQAVETDPANADAWNGLGWAQQNQGKSVSAKASFIKALSIDPKLAAALNGLGWIAKAEGKIDRAIGYWTKAVEAMPTATAALSGLAATHMELKKFDEAARYYEMWLKAEPGSADAEAGLKKAKAALDRE